VPCQVANVSLGPCGPDDRAVRAHPEPSPPQKVSHGTHFRLDRKFGRAENKNRPTQDAYANCTGRMSRVVNGNRRRGESDFTAHRFQPQPPNIRRPRRATWTEGRAVFIGHDDVSGTLDGLSSAGTAGEQPATSVTRKRFQPVEDRRGRRWLTRPRIRGHVWGCRGRRHDLRRQ
jgi:hypothetical protein